MHHKKCLLYAIILILTSIPIQSVGAIECPDVEFIFIRGSGGEAYTNADYLEFKNTIEEKIQKTSLSYDFIDLDYPAVSVGIENLSTALGAFISGGEAYKFGESVSAGIEALTNTVNSNRCPNTRFILGGYSQGAMVISKALPLLNSDKIIYAATFGDPKLFLPEGAGPFPDACYNKNLSDYRAYVPDCHVYEGLLGGYKPYQPENFVGKLGTWCNKQDIMCSRIFNFTDHLNYISDNLYEDASRKIYAKIIEAFNLNATYYAPHDTVILIDSTGSMAPFIDAYREEALRLASQTFKNGGRVALYDYRDLTDPYHEYQHCDFDTCTLESIAEILQNLEVDGGGDILESLLSAAFNVMNQLDWRYGAVKSTVILTDAGFHNPDYDGISYVDVVSLSRKIDPVNFYIITDEANAPNYLDLANDTDGAVLSINELNFVTDLIMERYDSLPKVEPSETTEIFTPTITIDSTQISDDSFFKINFTTNGEKTLIVLNDKILGITTDTTINITNLDFTKLNDVKLIPIFGENLGASIAVETPLILSIPNTGTI